MKQVLVIGGSGHVSGAVTRAALADGYKVYTLTRGTRPAVGNVTELHADRHDAQAVAKVVQSIANEKFDAVIDCICYNADDMQQDLECFAPLTNTLLFISTDWVYEPTLRRFPQPVENSPYLTGDNNGLEAYGWGKLMAENHLRENAPEHLSYTIFRPCHIYGMPSELGCFPGHCRDKELIARILKGETLELVDGGRLLQQPIDCDDLAKTMLSCIGNKKVAGKVFNMAGPDIVESSKYYEMIGDALNVKVKIKDIDYNEYLEKNPGKRPFLFHRIYTQDDLKNADVYVPATPLAEGLKKHTLALREKLGL
ncbi:MAG: NAD-dependent epimerase/dehydratase family protein [Lentisphaerae bacterium]|nr:NAD-dependent epimerase/dehydratase family protein [Lentisphaerota bacterium]